MTLRRLFFALSLAAGLAPVFAAQATTLDDTRITAPRSRDEGTIVCGLVSTYRWAPPHDPHRVAGTVIGVVAGAAVGAQFGAGKGNLLSAAGGATAGAFIGRGIQGHFQHGRMVDDVEHRCVFVPPGDSGVWSDETPDRPIAP